MEFYLMTKHDKLESFLNTGAELTGKQITSMFGLQSPSRAVNYLREKGVCVYSNPRTLHDGTRTVKYRVGRPSRAIVAAGFAALTA